MLDILFQSRFSLFGPPIYQNLSYIALLGRTIKTMYLVEALIMVIRQDKHRPIYQTVFMLSIAINRAEHVCATVIIKHNVVFVKQYRTYIGRDL